MQVQNSENTFAQDALTPMAHPPKEDEGLPITKKDVYTLLLIVMLSICQGITLGFCIQSMLLILAERGIDYATVGVLLLVKAPISFKFVFAPLSDSYYIKRLGRRKTYLLPAEIILGMI